MVKYMILTCALLTGGAMSTYAMELADPAVAAAVPHAGVAPALVVADILEHPGLQRAASVIIFDIVANDDVLLSDFFGSDNVDAVLNRWEENGISADDLVLMQELLTPEQIQGFLQ